MKFKNPQRVIIIMMLIVIIELAYLLGFYTVYLLGFYTPNKISYAEENPIENSESDFEIKSEFLDEDCGNLTITEGGAIIYNSESEVSHADIIFNEARLWADYIQLVDCYEEGDWYCYYIYSDGDCYVITLKNRHVDREFMLN